MNWELLYLHELQNFSNPVIDKIMVFLSTLGNVGVIWILFAILLLITKRYRKLGIQVIIHFYHRKFDIKECNSQTQTLCD